MTVPIHNLYDFVHLVTKKQYLLLYQFPFGSRNLQDVFSHQPDMQHINGPLGINADDWLISKFVPVDQVNHHWIHKTQPILFCHDQEPLNYNLYLDDNDYVKNYRETCPDNSRNFYFKNSNLRWAQYTNIQKSWTLLHSELNSTNLQKYESTGRFVGAYWWSHALISLDWYRFAQHDISLSPKQIYDRLFLVYCRDTTGSRQYRQDFLQQINQRSLNDHCQFHSFDGTDPTSDSSAVYNTIDYNSTAISVVLETVFDERIHLTEKVLRPIACGHPFILAAGPGSLRLLQKYGFNTFSKYIDESYDDIQDADERLTAIVKEMNRIQNLSEVERNYLISNCRIEAEHNRKRFFSQAFYEQIVNELITNVDLAWQKNKGELDLELWWNTNKWYKKNGLGHIPSRAYKNVFLPIYRKSRH